MEIFITVFYYSILKVRLLQYFLEKKLILDEIKKEIMVLRKITHPKTNIELISEDSKLTKEAKV